jgi:hypothetical protein
MKIDFKSTTNADRSMYLLSYYENELTIKIEITEWPLAASTELFFSFYFIYTRYAQTDEQSNALQIKVIHIKSSTPFKPLPIAIS